jgi:hypothetical protein
MPRYRSPIDWMVFMLAGVEIWHWSQKMWMAARGSYR